VRSPTAPGAGSRSRLDEEPFGDSGQRSNPAARQAFPGEESNEQFRGPKAMRRLLLSGVSAIGLLVVASGLTAGAQEMRDRFGSAELDATGSTGRDGEDRRWRDRDRGYDERERSYGADRDRYRDRRDDDAEWEDRRRRSDEGYDDGDRRGAERYGWGRDGDDRFDRDSSDEGRGRDRYEDRERDDHERRNRRYSDEREEGQEEGEEQDASPGWQRRFWRDGEGPFRT